MGRMEGKGRWVNDALRTGDQVVCTGARKMATVAPTIPQLVQPYSGTELDPKLPY